jgi:MFS family permease
MRIADPIHRLSSNRPLAALVYASAISGAGDWIYLTAFPVLIFERSGNFGLVGLAAVARFVPFFVLSMPAGIAADRFPPRLILILTETIRCLAMLLIAGLCVLDADVPWVLLLIMIAAGAGTFSMPALATLVPEFADNDAQMGEANAIRATLDSLAGVAGPALAGGLVILGGLPVAFALNGASFAVVTAALVIWRPTIGRRTRLGVAVASDGEPAIPWATLVRRIAGPLALDGAISFASAATAVLAVLIAVDWLRVGPSFTGALNAGAGAGGIVGGLIAGAAVNANPRLGVITGVACFSVAFVVLGFVPVPAFAVFAMALALGALILLDTLNMTALQRITVDGGTGRATGIIHTCAAVWMMAGALVPTVCMALLGIQAAIIGPAAVMLALGGLSVVRLRIAEPEFDMCVGLRLPDSAANASTNVEPVPAT